MIKLFDKKVDKSLLRDGLTIPVDKQDDTQKELGIFLSKGENKEIDIIINDIVYKAKFTWINLNENSNRDVYQIRYSKDSEIAIKLREIFSYTNKLILKNEAVTEDEMLEVFSTSEGSLEFKVHPKKVDSMFFKAFNKIMNEYPLAKKKKLNNNNFASYFRSDLKNTFMNSGIINKDKYIVATSVGQGNWATVPWICIFDKEITTTAQKGVYIVYLLSEDCRTLYLTFNQGCTDIKKNRSTKETIEILEKNASEIQSKIDNKGFKTDRNITLGENLTGLGRFYEEGTILYKAYKKGEMPEENILRQDLKNMMEVYKEYAKNIETKEETIKPDDLNDYQTIEMIKRSIKAKGFTYNSGLVENFYLSLKSKPFVILAGTSGTGKTKMVQMFAEAIGATSENGRYKLVPVRPDWSDSTDLFGHVDLNGRFIKGAILDFIKEAELNTEKPYFLCFDEMNLARVEYYLSDVLSIIETRRFKGNNIVTNPIIELEYYSKDAEAAEKYGEVMLPENLYIIGTVNMDETTFPFSKKVLDRANTIEFSHIQMIPQFDNEIATEEIEIDLDNEFLKTHYLLLNDCKEHEEYVNSICEDLQEINKILSIANSNIGYRIRDEIVFYMLNNMQSKVLENDEAMDFEIMQKILPRIQGSSSSIKEMLSELFKYCAGDFEGYQIKNNDISSNMIMVADGPDCKYKQSAKKIAFMVRRFEEDGFTSYWI